MRRRVAVWADAVARRVEAEQARVVELKAAHAAERDALAAEHVEAERALEAMQATLKEERAAVAAEREALSQERGAVPPRATGAAATDADLNHRLIMAIQVDPLLRSARRWGLFRAARARDRRCQPPLEARDVSS